MTQHGETHHIFSITQPHDLAVVYWNVCVCVCWWLINTILAHSPIKLFNETMNVSKQISYWNVFLCCSVSVPIGVRAFRLMLFTICDGGKLTAEYWLFVILCLYRRIMSRYLRNLIDVMLIVIIYLLKLLDI